MEKVRDMISIALGGIPVDNIEIGLRQIIDYWEQCQTEHHNMNNAMGILTDALQEIKHNQGHVCGEFEICDHRSCRSSHASWEIADKALNDLLLADKTAVVLDDDEAGVVFGKDGMRLYIPQKEDEDKVTPNVQFAMGLALLLQEDNQNLKSLVWGAFERALKMMEEDNEEEQGDDQRREASPE